MNATQALIGFTAWTLLLVIAVFTHRGARSLAPWVLCALVAQSAAHLWGVGPLQVLVRAGFWAVQLVLFVWMLLRLAA